MMIGHIGRYFTVGAATSAALYAAVRWASLAASLAVLAAVAVWVLGFVVVEVIRRSTKYRITTSEVVKEYGIIVRRDPAIPLVSVITSEAEQTIPERLLKNGSVRFTTAANDPTIDDIVFEGVPNPKGVSAKFKAARAAARNPQAATQGIPDRYAAPAQQYGQAQQGGGYAQMPGSQAQSSSCDEAPGYEPAPSLLPPR